MQFNNLQPNNTHNASFALNTAAANQQQQGSNPQGSSVLPLHSSADLANNLAARNLQTYNTISTPQGPTDPLAADNWNLPEYQPIKPGAPYLEKLADEAANTKKVGMLLKHAQEYEAEGDFKDAEKAYKKALKYTESAEHYKAYGECLRAIYRKLSQVPSTPEKDEAKERLYREKTARAFYYLGDLYKKQGALQDAQAAYQAACDLVLHEAPLKALLEVSQKLGIKEDITGVLVKLADFYTEKGDTALAIKMLEEALQVEKSSTILEKLAALHGQVGGEGSQLKVNEARIQQFELQISQDPKNISLYRDYAWFLKDIGKRNEARAVKKRMDGLLQTMQQKIVKQKTRLGDLKQTIHLQAEAIHHLQASVQANASKKDTAIDGLQTKVVSFENVKLPEQAKSLNSLNDRIEFLGGQIVDLDLSKQTDIQDADLIPLLKKNPYIKFLNLEGCEHLTDAVLQILPERFENLQELNLSGCKQITEAGLECIAENASKLKRLTLDHCPGTTIKLLHKLNAKGIAFTIEGITFKKNRLDLSKSKDTLTDDALRQALEANPEITELSVFNCQKITDAGLAPLKNFQWLTSLNLGACSQLTYGGLRQLAGLTQLSSLNLQRFHKLTDTDLQHLVGLTQLTSLNLDGCSQLTDGGLQHLASLTQLFSLNLHSCYQLTDGGLQHLAGLTQLMSLTLLHCTKLTRNAKEQLKKQIPGLRISG